MSPTSYRTAPPRDDNKNTAWQRPTLAGGEPPTTIGAEKLNFRVRDGNGCDLLAIATKLMRFIPSKLDNVKKNKE